VTTQTLESYLDTHKDRFLEELLEYLRIPSVSTDPAHEGDVKRCAEWVKKHLLGIGLSKVEIHETPGHPIVYAEHCHQPGKPTVLLYGHYDVQPPDPLEEWITPPFEPTIRDGKIFARGATDDKGQVFAHFKGLEALLATAGELPINLKMVIEGEEEVGSVNLENWVKANADMLKCDSVVISDSSMFSQGLPSITYGLRGLMYCEIKVTGPGHDLHSGMYGGAVPNPINALAQMIGTLHDGTGRIQVEGFYDGVEPLSSEERAQFASLPHSDDTFLKEVNGVGLHGEAEFTTLERIWARPTLDCNGIIGGFTGKGAKTVIPSSASAKISCRLVPGQSSEDIGAKVKAHLERVAPDYVKFEFDLHHGGEPIVVSLDNQTVQAAKRALRRAWDVDAVAIRSGGSIPVVATFGDVLGAPVVLIGLGLADDRLHSPNEKFDVTNFYHGISTSAYFYDELAK
jgi:acetylornithine deacetylase/succinyl-diaminopimelate desuccinylase-like protein